jgi:hypothetical protein
MLARIITESEGMVNYWFGQDDELDAALILSGYVDHRPRGRYCFQTTYVNECYREYYEHTNGHRMVWVLRNPVSVVYSMLHNWGNPNRVFVTCGVPMIAGIDKWMYKLFGLSGVSTLRRACWGYIGKTSQLFDLKQHLDPDTIIVVDYDDLVMRKEEVLPAIYSFVDLEYRDEYADKIHSRSLRKGMRFSRHEIATVMSKCEPTYQKARALLTIS